MEYFYSQGERVLAFGDLDQKYRFKHRAFIEICMPPLFSQLEREFDMLSLRQEGIATIMFYLDFQSSGLPLAFGRKARCEARTRICRTDERSGTPGRLLLDALNELHAHPGSGNTAALGFDQEKKPIQVVGSCRVLQVFTRPLASPEKRRVKALPAALGAFTVQPFTETYPSLEMLQEAPSQWQEVEGGADLESVWGMQNTDVNQHVNVMEYITHLENHVTRLLAAAGLPVAMHYHKRARLIFRRPCFGGERFVLRGRLWCEGERTLAVTALHVGENGQEHWAERPNVVARFEGEFLTP